MKETPFRYHSDTEQNPRALYPGAANSPLNHQAVADDDDEQADACEDESEET